MVTSLDADVIVAGAGPAGAAAAIHLRNAGMHVLLLDQQTFPRDKVCGDFLSAVALSELQVLGIRPLVQRQSNPIKRATLYLDARHLVTSCLPKVGNLPSSGSAIPRKLLDHLLVMRAVEAGAHLAERHRTVRYRAQSDHVEVDVQAPGRAVLFRARALIGADGSTSVIAKQLRGHPALTSDQVVAVRAYFDAVNGPADRADLYFSSAAFPGYCWLFPTGPRTANVGVGIVGKTLPRTREHLPKLLRQLISSDAALGNRLRGANLTHPIVGWPLTTFNAKLPIVADRVALVGDAAGLINPLNGEGIQYALLSGRWVAEMLAASESRGDFPEAALQMYAARVDTEISPDLELSRLIINIIRNRALNSLWLAALEAIVSRAAIDDEYAAITGGVLAGIVPTRRVMDLDIVRKTLEQAAVRAGILGLRQLLHRPASLPQLAVALTEAALAAARPMLTHRADAQDWAMAVGRVAMDVTSTTVKTMAASAAHGNSTARMATSRMKEATWRGRRVQNQVRPAVGVHQQRRADASDAPKTSRGSRRSVARPRKS
jgi:geranylgeranyl reductase family protein